MSGTTIPTVRVCRLLRLAAIRLRWYFNRSAAAITRSRRSGETVEFPLKTFETVPRETPAAIATSFMVDLARIAAKCLRGDETFHRPTRFYSSIALSRDLVRQPQERDAHSSVCLGEAQGVTHPVSLA